VKINEAGLALLKSFEGCRLSAYQCSAGRWTIGWGHASDVKEGDKITEHQAEAILDVDLDRFETGVSKLCPNAAPNQFSALVCFAFNVGLTNFAASRLLARYLAGGPLAAANEFKKWVHVKGVVVPGLVRRRQAERALFLL
jgi:lysozyme